MADDLHARAMLARIRSALTGAEVDPINVGRFEIVRVLGRGGMGVVYEARDPDLGRVVALKVIDATGSRVLQEAKALARVQHPAIVQVHEAGVVGDQVYIAMELVAGARLDQWLEAERPSTQDVVRVFRAAGHGLAAAHDKGVVHGDFKPQNVLVTNARDAKVVDFGLARIDRTDVDPGSSIRSGTAGWTVAGAGTPAYMAPEQLTGIRADERSDQFSFCVTLFEALSGRRPFFGATSAEIADRACRGELDRTALLAIPSSLRGVLQRGLAHTPEARYPSMHALVAALQPKRRWPYLAAAATIAASIVVWQLAITSSPARPAAAAAPPPPSPAPTQIVVVPVDAAPSPVAEVAPAKPSPPTRVAATKPKPKPPDEKKPIGWVDDPQSPGMLASVEVMNAGKAEQAGNTDACLRMLDRAHQIDPRPEGRMAVITRARCEMRAGRCDDGKRRLAALDGNTAWAIEDAARLAEVLCPVVDGALDARLERLRMQSQSEKLCPQAAVLAGAETALAERGTMSAPQTRKLASVFYYLAQCFARKLSCDEAKRARSGYMQVNAKLPADQADAAATDWVAVECTDAARAAEEQRNRERDEFFKRNRP